VSDLHRLAGVAPTAIAVEDGVGQLSWAELDRRSTLVGNGVEALGAIPGTHVAICVSNRTEFIEASIGAWRAGCSYTPVKTGWTAREIGDVLDNAETRVVVTDREGARAAASERGLPVIDLDADYEGWLAEQSDAPLTGERFGFKMSYTSGTTGRPKGVRLPGSGTTPFDQAWAGLAYWAEVQQLPGEGAHLFVSRLFNGAPNTFGMGAMARGATLRIMRSWDPAAALAALAAPDVTSTIMVPTMFRQLLALPGVDRSVRPAPQIVTILHGGEPCPIPLKEAIADWFGEVLVEYYGFSEGGFTIVAPEEWRSRPGTVGRPIGGMTVKILDADGHEVGPHTEGTVYFQPPPGRTFSYQNDSAKTAAAYRGDAYTVGDIGWLDEDGFLYLCGREADVVVSAGVNVYPAEIEQALFDVPGVRDLCAVGGPDDERAEAVVLFVALAAGTDSDTVLAALDAAATERLAGYKRPRTTVVVDDIPRDQTGKMLRRVLRDPLWEGHDHFAASGPSTSTQRVPE